MRDDELLRYDDMLRKAYIQVVHEALSQVAEHGLPARNHFYIAFRTGAPGVEIPDFLAAKYPDEMVIVLQHQFWDLEVADDQFSVWLAFNKARHRIVVPFDALTGFADPGVRFALKFEAGDTPNQPAEREEAARAEAHGEAAEPAGPAEEAADEDESGKIVTLDAFRKKK